MKAKLAVAAVLAMLMGCMNVCTRCPFTDAHIEKTWQCTTESAGISYIVMFPQTMGYGNSKGFIAENIFTIPIGCICFVDVACEAVVDTVLWPIDYAVVH